LVGQMLVFVQSAAYGLAYGSLQIVLHRRRCIGKEEVKQSIAFRQVQTASAIAVLIVFQLDIEAAPPSVQQRVDVMRNEVRAYRFVRFQQLQAEMWVRLRQVYGQLR